ncbi:MAG: ABC transporter substrate-binding protein, partial [Anaerolineales bacterium]
MLSSKKLMLLFGILLIASMVLAACAPAPTAAPPETVVETVVVTVEGEGETVVQVVTPTPEPVAAPDTLVICMGQEPETLFPYGGSMLASSSVLEAVMEGNGGQAAYDSRTFAYQAIINEKLPSLADGDAVINEVTASEGDTVVDANQNVITLDAAADPPQMINVSGGTDPVEYTGGDVTMDQMVVTFKLLEGVQWSDGEPVKASDFVYAFNVAADPDTTYTKYTIERTASYEAPDDLTNVWTGLPGYKDSVYMTNMWGPFPEHIWGQYTVAELLTVIDADVATNLIGYGPYKIVEWNRGDNVRMVKNE